MRLLAVLALFVAPLADPGPRPLAPLPERPQEVCALARQIASQPPCLAGGDCEALQLWRRAFGPPGNQLLPPGSSPAAAAALRLPPGRLEPAPLQRLHRALGNCLAATADRGSG